MNELNRSLLESVEKREKRSERTTSSANPTCCAFVEKRFRAFGISSISSSALDLELLACGVPCGRDVVGLTDGVRARLAEGLLTTVSAPEEFGMDASAQAMKREIGELCA